MVSWKHIFRLFFGANKNPHLRSKDDFKNNNKMGWNIYEKEGTPIGEHLKNFHIVHFIFKYRFFVPLIHIATKLLNKAINKKPSNEWYDKNLNLFNKSYRASIDEWVDVYIGTTGNGKSVTACEHIKTKKEGSVGILHSLGDILLTMCLYDTAYREFLNILLHRIAKDMHDEYKGQSPHLHLVYDRSYVYDVYYYVIGQRLQEINEETGKKILKGNIIPARPRPDSNFDKWKNSEASHGTEK